ncbi:PAS domain-containing protein, partial [Absicoccus porci]|uniref:PAS domain-containing protein n=1 Tax=Absicoccus porci TaxID=2486576 RepID=UPI003D8B2B37
EILHDIPNNRSRIEEMIFKENQILFPLALEKFSKEMWYQIYQDMPIYGNTFIAVTANWPEAETYRRPISEGILHFENGDLTVAQFEAICQALPVELTYIDANDMNRFFSITNGVFARPKTALNRKVYSCHPPRVQPMVKQMLADFKAHKQTKVERWVKNTRIQYVAMYDQQDQYMGCLEIVQDFDEFLSRNTSMPKSIE